MGERVDVYEFPNCIVRCHHPDLTEEERVRRQEIIYHAAERFAMKVIETEIEKGIKIFDI